MRPISAPIWLICSLNFPISALNLLGSATPAEALEVGYFKPKMLKASGLETGEVGYIITGLRDVSRARVGDTVTAFTERARKSGK